MADLPTSRITAVVGDISTQAVDAIVNAANSWLLGGGGVDGAIHRAAGPRLLEACRVLPAGARGERCPVGEVRITPGFDLPARFVIHTVGPIYSRHDPEEAAELLAACHARALALAAARGLQTVAFPAISTGAYGYPMEAAGKVARAAVEEALAGLPAIREVRFVLHAARDLRDFTREW